MSEMDLQKDRTTDVRSLDLDIITDEEFEAICGKGPERLAIDLFRELERNDSSPGNK